MMRAGERAYAPGLGWLAIDTVEQVDLRELGDDDARADGFDTVAALRKVLYALYPDHCADGKNWFRVEFTPAELTQPRKPQAADRSQQEMF